MSVFKRILCNKNIECRVYKDKNGSRYVLFGAGFWEGEEVIEDVYKVYECTSGLELTEDRFTMLKDNTYVFDEPFCDLTSDTSLSMIDKGINPVEYGMCIGF